MTKIEGTIRKTKRGLGPEHDDGRTGLLLDVHDWVIMMGRTDKEHEEEGPGRRLLT